MDPAAVLVLVLMRTQAREDVVGAGGGIHGNLTAAGASRGEVTGTSVGRSTRARPPQRRASCVIIAAINVPLPRLGL